MTCVVRRFLSTLAKNFLLIALIALAAAATPVAAQTCTPTGTAPSVTICSPANNATVPSPVSIVAAANSTTAVKYMQVYIDGVKKYEILNTSKLSTSLALAAGAHRLTVQANNGTTTFKSTISITVSSGTGGGVSVTVSPDGTSIPPGGTQQFTATVTGTTNTAVDWYVDGVLGGDSTNGTISTAGLYTAPNVVGSHKIMAVSKADPSKSAQVSVGVSSSACTAGGTDPSVTICAPTNNANVASPVNVLAAVKSSKTVQFMQIYVDGVKQFQQNSVTSINTNVAMASGTRKLTVQAYNGAYFKTTVFINVTNTPQLSVSVSPTSATIAKSATQQFTATVTNAADTSVTWSVDGTDGGNATVGTIDNTGLYTAPNTDSIHTVTATSNADSTKSDSATVTVGTPQTSSFGGMFTYKYGNTRQGANTDESLLTPANVNKTNFGKKWTYAVDGYVYAMPLYVPGVSINGKTYNVIYVATEHNSVYAFDADGSTTTALWKKNFLINGATTIPQSDVGSTIFPEIGITGTPVIDQNTGTLYVVAVTKESGAYKQRLHALSITTGAEKFGGPKEITASVAGSGDGTANGQVAFQAKIELQRPALTLSNGVVWIAWASHGDNGPYHGWVIGYDASSLAQVAVHNNTPNNRRAGIWMSGGGMPVDANGNLYYMSGNGTFTANTGGTSYGDSFVKLNSSGKVVDYFTPFDQSNMNAHDLDVGVGAPTLLPGNRLVGADKKGSVYVLDTSNMGQFNSSNNSQIAQYLDKPLVSHCHAQPVYWNGHVYITAETGPIYDFRYSNGLLQTPAKKTSQIFDFPGTNPVVSSNGTANGILWAIDKPSSGGAVLRAFDANDLTKELYNSTQSGTRDSLTTAVKFVPPTVANGRVYVGLKGQVAVFGLLK